MKRKDVILVSRYEDVTTVVKFIDSNSAVITTNGNYTRNILSEDSTHIEAIDFEGGPMLYVGEVIPTTDKKVKSIKNCYYIELE